MDQKQLEAALSQIKKVNSPAELEERRLHYLGRKGVLTLALRQISELTLEKRKVEGRTLNQFKSRLEDQIKNRRQGLLQSQVTREAQTGIDLSAPAGGHSLGHPSPVKELEKELVQAFWQLGFSLAEGPEIESDWYNFEALNIPADHPARDMFDTFYMPDSRVLRTHTSPVQIRYMEGRQPPIRVIALGRAYRNEDEDATHLAVFNQIEGLVVDKGINLADLKGTLLYMFRAVLGAGVNIKLLPSYFPFVEPALEVHVSCVVCDGKDVNCRTCKGVGWIEVCGAGMVHPKVLSNVGIDPDQYSGFAFGGGLERISAIKHQVADIRHFWRPDLRFINQFK